MHTQILIINHYLGTWEQFSFRNDPRTAAERSEAVRVGAPIIVIVVVVVIVVVIAWQPHWRSCPVLVVQIICYPRTLYCC
jgi:hypothetical protein